MHIVKVCTAFGWTYEQYMNQPNWFIELAEGMRVVDNNRTAPKVPKKI